MKCLKCVLLLPLMIALSPVPAFSAEDAQLYWRAIREARSGQRDFALMHYEAILRDHPDSRFASAALFAKAEYYFLLPQFKQATGLFQEWLQQNPESRDRLFALAYLYQIAKTKNQEQEAELVRKEIVSFKQVGLVFKEFKELSFTSPLQRNHRAVFRIDGIEFYVEGELFAEIPL